MNDMVSHTPVEVQQAAERSASRRRSTVALVAVGLVSSALALAAYATGVFASVELDSVDARFAIRGSHDPALPLAVVGFDDRTLRGAGAWPVRRLWHARTIDALHRDGARAIVYDVQFTEPSPLPEDDNELIRAVERARGRVVLGTTEANELGESNVLGGPVVLDRIGARVGNALLAPDSDGTIRQVPYRTDRLESFGLVVAGVATGRRIEPAQLGGERAWIDYVGPPGTVPHYSVIDVAEGGFEPGSFRGKVVVVGATSASLQDIHRTPTGARMDGPELQANVIATALAGFPLQSAPGWFEVVLILVCGLLVPVLRLRLSLGRALLAAGGAGAALAAGTQIAFQAGWVTSFVYPLLALLLSLLGVFVLAVDATQPRSRTA